MLSQSEMMRKKGYLENERLRLRAVEPEDLEIMYDIENDPGHWSVGGITQPISRYTLRQYIESSVNDFFADRQLRLMIVKSESEEVIGTLDLSDYDPIHQRAAVGIVIRQSYRKSGFATEALQLLCEYSFGYLRLHQLYAFVAADNQPSLSLFSRCGFVKAGELKDWLCIEAEWNVAIIMQKTADF